MEHPNRAHHRTDRLAARRRFDDVECTISHLLRFPHPALGGRRYGEALLQAAGARGIRPGRSGVIEVGGGAGHVAEAAWRASRRALEASPPRGAHLRWSGIRADALELPIRSRSVDGLLLANEVIADLPVEGTRNAGAVRLVEEIARVLLSGGAALLTEFGGDFDPGPVRLSGALGRGEHVEWSIDFRQLRAAGEGLGLAVEELPLHALLGADLSVRCASYTDLWRLRRVTSCEVFAAPEAEVRRRFPLLSRLLALELPELGSPRWPDATAPAGFAQLFRALILRRP